MRLFNAGIKINNMELKNRLVMPPMAISKADESGKATSKTFDYYEEKSAGGYIVYRKDNPRTDKTAFRNH